MVSLEPMRLPQGHLSMQTRTWIEMRGGTFTHRSGQDEGRIIGSIVEISCCVGDVDRCEVVGTGCSNQQWSKEGKEWSCKKEQRCEIQEIVSIIFC